MEILINLLFCFGLALIFTSKIEPLQDYKFNHNLLPQQCTPETLKYYLCYLLNCTSCVSFWIYLLIFQDFKLGIICFLMSEVYFMNKKTF